MVPIRRTSLPMILALAALAGPAAGAGFPVVRVLDESGRPIRNAAVSFAWYNARGKPIVTRRLVVASEANGGVEEDVLETIDRLTDSSGLAVCDSCKKRVGW